MAKQKKKNDWLDWIKALLIALILGLIVRTFFFAPIVVDGPSMLPTLQDRDQMIVNKINYRFNDPKRFDIVVFHASEKKDFIKRVIGLPREHVKVTDNVLYINGEKVDEPFLGDVKTGDSIFQPIGNDFELEELPGNYDVIPEGYYLVLGDNRNNSTDSRTIGLISKDQIVGKTNLIYWPYKRWQVLDAQKAANE